VVTERKDHLNMEGDSGRFVRFTRMCADGETILEDAYSSLHSAHRVHSMIYYLTGAEFTLY
jgi:hypothetical protein